MTPASGGPYAGLGDGFTALALREAGDQTLGRFHALMQTAFTPAELMPYGDLRAARQSPTTNGTLVLAGEEPVAGIVTEAYQDGRILLVAYLVVAVPARNAGLGSRLLGSVAPRDAGPDAPLVLAEVEDPRFHPPSDRGDPVARLRFYDRAGARLLPLPYSQPSLRAGSARVDGMLLIAIGARGPDVDGRLVAAFIEEYYAASEGRRTVQEDPALAALHSTALGDERGRLALHPVFALEAARPAPPA
jgi:hypothetical protein